MAGTITARSSTSLTVRTTRGKTEKLALSTGTKAYRVVVIARGQLRTQSFVALSARLVDGRVAARDVVTALSGTMVTIFTPGKAIIRPAPPVLSASSQVVLRVRLYAGGRAIRPDPQEARIRESWAGWSKHHR